MRYSLEEMLKMTPQEFAENWVDIGASAYEMIGGEVEEKSEDDTQDQTEEKS